MEEFKYYTMFGLRLHSDADMIPKYSRDFILRWTTNEREACKLGQAMIENKLFKTTPQEALEAVGMNSEAYSISGIKIRMSFNPDITAHLFETVFPMDDEMLQIMIDAANVSDFGKQKLAEARIKL